MSLLGLTLVSSHSRVFAVHEVFVGLWLSSSLMHMITNSYLEQKYLKGSYIRIRRFLTYACCFSAFFMLYFYFRHNSYCEPFVYSYFCIFEYSVILMNMIYQVFAPPIMAKALKQCLKYPSIKGIPSTDEETSQLLAV